MTAPETQNAPLPGHSALLGPFCRLPQPLGCSYTVNYSLLQMQLHGASSVAEIIVSHKSMFIALRSHSCRQARGIGRQQNVRVAAGYGYLWGGDLTIN